MSVGLRHAFTRVSYMGGAALIALFMIGVYPLRAQGAPAISQDFQTSETNVATGAIMSLKTSVANTVELANTDRVEQLIGVVGNKPLVELSNNAASVVVVTSGVTYTLVSTLNGDVKNGDKITASPINGIGMKASHSAPVVGTAQADLSSVTTTDRTITDTDGQSHTVKVGLVPLQVNVTFYEAPDDRSSFLPPFLQSLANTVAGRQVSPVRIVVAAIALFLAFISIAVLLYSSVKSSIISIGRNPLSEGAVRKSLFEVGATIIGILLLTLIAIYLILIT